MVILLCNGWACAYCWLGVLQVMGIAVFSSQLDAHFNSVRGVAFCKHLMARYPCGIFDMIVRHKSAFESDGNEDGEEMVGEAGASPTHASPRKGPALSRTVRRW